jgi:hypothetical protein
LLTGLGVAVLVCMRAVDNSFRADDFVFLDHVVQARSLGELLRSSSNFAFYRPAALALFWAEHQLFGFWAGGYIVFNLLLHATNSWLLLRVLRQLDVNAWVSRVATAFFLLGVGHYAKQLLWACTSGGLAAVTTSLVAMLLVLDPRQPTDSTGRPRLPLLLGVWALMFLAMALHEAALAMSILLALAWRRRDAAWRQMWVWFVPAVVWIGALATLSNDHPAYGRAPLGVLLAPLYVLRYPGFMLLPIQPEQSALARPLQILLAASMLGVSIAILRRRDAGTAKFLVLWLYVALLPFGLITLPNWWLEIRYLYFAAMPFCALLALGLAAVQRPPLTRLLPIAIAATTMLVIGALALQLYIEHRGDQASRSDENLRRLQDLRNAARPEAAR